MEITSLATMVTMNYAKRKHLSASRDKRELECSIKIARQQLDASPFKDRSLEAELAYLTEALKNLEMEIAKEECKANSVKAQFRMQKLKERLQIRPQTKSTITEIITTEVIEEREVKTKHRTQWGVQTQIEEFYRDLYRKRECKDKLEDVQEFLGNTDSYGHKEQDAQERNKRRRNTILSVLAE